MLEALAKAEYLTPTPVQAGLIPRALAGVDVLGQARTGTGKTAAFVIPILEIIEASHHKGTSPQALVLVPTRELAVQVRDEAVKLAQGRKLHIVPLYGGKPLRAQIEKLKKGVDIAIGTPGRVIDHLGRGTLDLRDLKFVVLDEADRMLDIGFRPDIEKILRKCPASRQTLLLSATVPPPVEKLAKRYMRDPETLNFSAQEISVETIEQFYFTVDPERKFDLLERLIAREEPRQAIIFCRTKRGTDKVNHRLGRKFKDVACIHGDLAQNVRDRVMAAFREGKVRYLVATDVVGRGIDVTGISHIINYDIPQFCDDYVHRVGRTGRMGREGVAYTFVSPEEGNELTRIEMRIDRLLKRDEIQGFIAVVERQRNGEAAPAPAPSGVALPGDAAEETPAAKPRPAPLLGRGGRPPRRIRRAL
jgi:ATP-dependent RNA helicase DeaD